MTTTTTQEQEGLKEAQGIYFDSFFFFGKKCKLLFRTVLLFGLKQGSLLLFIWYNWFHSSIEWFLFYFFEINNTKKTNHKKIKENNWTCRQWKNWKVIQMLYWSWILEKKVSFFYESMTWLDSLSLLLCLSVYNIVHVVGW